MTASAPRAIEAAREALRIEAQALAALQVGAEMQSAVEAVLAGLARGKYIAAPALRRILAARGLITLDGADCALTDLGRAFVARTEGGA